MGGSKNAESALIQQVAETPYAMFEQNEKADTLWIIFSHVNIPEGKFAQSHVTEGFPVHRLFLNCPDNAWYQKGVPGIAGSMEALRDWVLAFVEELGVRKTVCIGHSMGGYMAVLFGTFLPNGTYLATTPEMNLGLPFSRSEQNGVKAAKGWEEIDGQLANDDRDDVVTRGWVLYGAYDPVDAYFLSRHDDYEAFGARVLEVPHHHGVTEYLTRNRLYRGILADLSDSGFEELAERGVLSPPLSLGPRQRYRHFYDTFALWRTGADKEALLKSIGRFQKWRNPGWQYLRAQIFNKLEMFDDWLATAREAFELDEDVLEYAVEYANAMVRTGEMEDLSRVGTVMRRRYGDHRQTSALLERLTEKQRELFETDTLGQQNAVSTGPESGARPNLFLAGWQLCGTEYLASVFRDHDQTYMPKVREPAFMNRPENKLNKGLEEYYEHFAEGQHQRYRIDATSTYFWHRSREAENRYRKQDDWTSLKGRNWTVPEAIRSFAGEDAKFVIVLRNPLSRLISGYYRNFRRGRMQGDEKLSVAGRRYGLIDMGFFDKTYDYWREHFSADNFIFVRFEDLRDDPLAAVNAVCQSLNIAPVTKAASYSPSFGLPLRAYDTFIGYDFEAQIRMIGRGEDIDENTLQTGVATAPVVTTEEVQKLNKLYAHSISRIEDVTGWDLGGWRTNSLSEILRL